MAELTIQQLAERVERLEAIVRELQSRSNVKEGRAKDWRRTIGMFAGDEDMQEIFELGRQIRQADRDAAKQQGTE